MSSKYELTIPNLRPDLTEINRDVVTQEEIKFATTPK